VVAVPQETKSYFDMLAPLFRSFDCFRARLPFPAIIHNADFESRSDVGRDCGAKPLVEHSANIERRPKPWLSPVI